MLNATEPKKQGTQQPADEEIGDYANPDAIQVDGGDNSFVAGEDEKTDTTEKNLTLVKCCRCAAHFSASCLMQLGPGAARLFAQRTSGHTFKK